jgi:hypothetical protein
MLPRGWAALAMVAAVAVPARAQVASDELGIERFRPAIDRAGMLDVEWAGVPPHLMWSAGVLVGFAHDPLVVYASDMTSVAALVEQRLSTSLAGSIALLGRLQLGATLDIVGYQSGTDAAPAMASLPGGGIGDARVVAKLLVAGDARYQLALVPAVTVPGGEADGYLREAGIAFSPAVAASARLGRIRAATNVGYHIKPRVDSVGVISDDEAFARLALGVELGSRLEPIVELWAATSLAMPLGDADKNQIAIEQKVGLARRVTAMIDVFAAAGFGLDNGFGTPDWRALAGVRISPPAPEEAIVEPEPERTIEPVAPPRDDDRDGLFGADDRCPTEAEDKDGFRDDDGCADGLATVIGAVTDADGRPIAGAKVRITQRELAGAAAIELTAGDDGKFTTEVAGGALDITANASEYKETVTDATVEPGSRAEVAVKLTRAIRQGQLRGQVLAFNGKPLAATITVKGKTTASATTDADGHFTLELPEGAFSVEITSTGHIAQKRNVTIKLDGVTVLNVDLRSTK